MLKYLLKRPYLFSEFKVNKYQPKDYQTMCSLIKQRYPIYNESIVTSKDVKLLDQNNKLIGRYAASQARKKAMNMKKDILLVNGDTNPVICKVINFRESILKKFYDEIVIKRNEQIISKAQSSKQLKISLNLNENELKIKTKQIIQLAKKNLNVRIYTIFKQTETNDALGKFDNLKSLLLNRCTIEKQIRVQNYQEKSQDQKKQKKNQNNIPIIQKIISFVVRSKDNQFLNLLDQSKNHNPDQAIQLFLKRYYKQEDVQMRDLQYKKDNLKTQLMNMFLVEEKVKQKKIEGKSLETQQKRSKNQKEIMKQVAELKKLNSYTQNQAKARILNSRLKKILQII